MAANTKSMAKLPAGKGKRRKSKRSRRLLRFLLMEGGILGLILLAYLLTAMYYKDHFFKNTVINGVDTSNMTIEQAEAAINRQAEAYRLELIQRNGIKDTVYGRNIDLHTEFGQRLTRLMKEQNGLLWPKAVLGQREFEIERILTYNEAALQAYLDIMNGLKEENTVEPVNARIAYGEEGYEILPEEPGAKIIKNKLHEAVRNAILTMEPTLSLEEAGCYEEASVTSDNAMLKEALAELQKLAGTRIIYEFGEDVEVLDKSKIHEWISWDEDYKITLEEEKVREYVDYIGKHYNSFGRKRTFQTSYGEVIKVEGGDYGWWLDRVSETKELVQLILQGEQTVKKPVYFQTAQQYGRDDIGDTYVEVNLTAQHLFFYKDGELIVESDFVSGNLSKDYGTPTGTYPIQYKENNAVLVGEDYETPVKYWMPFNRNIGFHDADWRREFGKDIYKTKGSHGCINMPPENAKKMFENIKRGVAVVVYELPGTENAGS